MPGPMLTKAKVHRLQHLLDMQYKPAEIAAELGIDADTIYRSFLPAGAPYGKDEAGNIWIRGPEFLAWARDYLTTRERQPKPAMQPNQAFCLKCHGVVEIQDIQRGKANGRGVLNLTGKCPACGGRINRMISARTAA